MLEYKEMAKYYDMFYSNKSYEKEVEFILSVIGERKNILDVGCGTGLHSTILEQKRIFGRWIRFKQRNA